MKKTTIGITALVLGLGAAGVLAGTTFAYQGDPTVTGPYYSAERHEAMEAAFENSDYSVWKELMQGRGRVTQVVNESNFAQFAKAHELAEDGNAADAQKIRQDLGLGLHDGSGRGMGSMHRGAGNGFNR